MWSSAVARPLQRLPILFWCIFTQRTFRDWVFSHILNHFPPYSHPLDDCMGENPSRSAVTEILRLDRLAPAAMTVLLSCGIHQLYLQCTLYTVYEFLPRILELSTAQLFELFTRFCEQSKQASKMYLYRAFQDKETITTFLQRKSCNSVTNYRMYL